MKRSHRLQKDADFQTILNYKKSSKSNEFSLYGMPQIIGHTRVGISVSKKIGIAVIRNKIRRQIKMMLTQNLHFNDSIDYIIIVRHPYLKNNYQENQKSLLLLIDSLRRKLIG